MGLPASGFSLLGDLSWLIQRFRSRNEPMGKASNQWDFGELFEERALRKTYSVTELTGAIRRSLERDFGRVRVSGEISNFRLQSSGHCYFGLKDAGAQLSCVLFRGERGVKRTDLDHGVKVTLEGDLTVYEARGQYQLIVRAVELEGVGALQAAFEKLKAKLASEGLFEEARKRSIPRYCFRLGVVTSASAAALRDVLNVMTRRHPSMVTILSPVRVQGQGAEKEIAAAIDQLNRYSASLGDEDRLDAILVTRGGGSLEDLWAFNEELVARAVVASALPVVSGVGHEVDFTICDCVADLRAPTPSAAAELLTEGVFASRDGVLDAVNQLGSAAKRQWGHLTAIFNQVGYRLRSCHPQRTIELERQTVDEAESALLRALKDRRDREAQVVRHLGKQLEIYQPLNELRRQREGLIRWGERLREVMQRQLQRRRDQVDHGEKILHLLSPLNVLERGYSISRDAATGEVIASRHAVRAGTRVNTLVQDGEILSEVIETESSPAPDQAAVVTPP